MIVIQHHSSEQAVIFNKAGLLKVRDMETGDVKFMSQQEVILENRYRLYRQDRLRFPEMEPVCLEQFYGPLVGRFEARFRLENQNWH